MKKLKNILLEQNASRINKKLSKLDKKLSDQYDPAQDPNLKYSDRYSDYKPLDPAIKSSDKTVAAAQAGKYKVPIKNQDIPNKEEVKQLWKFINNKDIPDNDVQTYLQFIQKYQADPSKSKKDYANDPSYRKAGLFDKVCVRGDIKCASNGEVYIPVYDTGQITRFVDRNAHDFLLATSLVAGIAGAPWIAAGIGLVDAALYLSEGDKYTAGLCLVIEAMPFVGPIIGRSVMRGVKWTSKESKTLIPKLISKTGKLTAEELSIINNIKTYSTQYTKSIKLAINKTIKTTPKAAAKPGYKKALKDLGLTLTSQLALGYTVIQVYDELYKSIYGDAEFADMQKWFLSDKSKQDNLLMMKALEAGWSPGKEIPEEFQTETYKQDRLLLAGLPLDVALEELNNL
jgi:hypothetical protein